MMVSTSILSSLILLSWSFRTNLVHPSLFLAFSAAKVLVTLTVRRSSSSFLIEAAVRRCTSWRFCEPVAARASSWTSVARLLMIFRSRNPLLLP
jgi:hypothetical protein